jgi:DNA-binding transcriptional LysR family regulator
MLSVSMRQLEYAIAVCHHGGVSLAASAIHVSQPALSVAIRNLEQHLGQPLFIRRKGNPLALTSFGRGFMIKARNLVVQFEALTDPARVSCEQQHINLGCFDDLAPLYVGELMAQVKANLPHLHVNLRVGDFKSLSKDLLNGHIDMAITYNLGLQSSLHSETISQVYPHLLLPKNHPLNRVVEQQSEIDLRVISDYPLILVDQEYSVAHMLGLFGQQGMTATIVHRVANYEVMRSMVAAGLGLGMSYTRSRVDISYTGQAFNICQLNLPFAAEPVVLASNLYNPLTDGAQDLVAVIKQLVVDLET